MSAFSGPERGAVFWAFVYGRRLGRGGDSYSKIKVVWYHTMDWADFPQNSDFFGHEKAFRARRVWYRRKHSLSGVLNEIFPRILHAIQTALWRQLRVPIANQSRKQKHDRIAEPRQLPPTNKTEAKLDNGPSTSGFYRAAARLVRAQASRGERCCWWLNQTRRPLDEGRSIANGVSQMSGIRIPTS